VTAAKGGETGRTDEFLEVLDDRLRQAALIPPPLVGRPPMRCIACGQVWAGFDGNERSACCGESRTRLIERLHAQGEVRDA
jgi:hypothetical protein